MVVGQHTHDLFGLAGLGERGEIPEVAEDDDDLAAVTLQERLISRVQDHLGHLRWEEPPQTRGPLELRDL